MGGTVRIATAERPTKSEYDAARFQRRKEAGYNSSRPSRAIDVPEFIGVDSEGVTDYRGHRPVLLGVGSEQMEAPRGLRWQPVFEFLYHQFQAKPRAAYVGFYLGYDFNQWFRSLPRSAAWSLLSPVGRGERKSTRQGMKDVPVRAQGWEFDLLGFKRLQIRPQVCECHRANIKVVCEHKQKPWFYLCDSGPFFQMGFMSVIDPKQWTINGELVGWPCAEPIEGLAGDELYNKVLEGKERRAVAELDDDMRLYNRLENVLLSRVMRAQGEGFRDIGLRLDRTQWYGPGAAASSWLRSKGAPRRTKLEEAIPGYWLGLCKASYYGGWFEIFSHGICPGVSWNYDINNAYPYAIKQLPCMNPEHKHKFGRKQGSNVQKKEGRYILVNVRVAGASERIGPLPFRRKNGNILRPKVVRGWYWLDELEASIRAGLVDSYEVYEWSWFEPCQCSQPFSEIEDLYRLRLEVGKNTSKGKAIKLVNNSGYGKFAQNVGSAPYGNWFYASRITASCRIQILDAIGTHPKGIHSVLMVATDGICFDYPHSSLEISSNLGAWEETEYLDLTLFKPGVYWHRAGKEAVLKAKTRGVPKKALVQCIEQADSQFRAWQEGQHFPGPIIGSAVKTLQVRSVYGWPYLFVPMDFRMTSCAQALNEGHWSRAGKVITDFKLKQDSDPHEKRHGYEWNTDKSRLDSFVHTQLDTEYTTPYGAAEMPTVTDWGYTQEGPLQLTMAEVMGALRDGNHPHLEWETVWEPV
jgi:hypothetical protein